jgi:hypothetical protein
MTSVIIDNVEYIVPSGPATRGEGGGNGAASLEDLIKEAKDKNKKITYVYETSVERTI